jgi:hypothetical protein
MWCRRTRWLTILLLLQVGCRWSSGLRPYGNVVTVGIGMQLQALLRIDLQNCFGGVPAPVVDLTVARSNAACLRRLRFARGHTIQGRRSCCIGQGRLVCWRAVVSRVARPLLPGLLSFATFDSPKVRRVTRLLALVHNGDTLILGNPRLCVSERHEPISLLDEVTQAGDTDLVSIAVLEDLTCHVGHWTLLSLVIRKRRCCSATHVSAAVSVLKYHNTVSLCRSAGLTCTTNPSSPSG